MKRFIAFLISIFFLFSAAKPALAQSEFTIRSNVTYDVSENASVHVTHDFTLINAFSNYYAKSFSLYLEGVEPKEPKAFDQEGNSINLKVEAYKEGGTSLVAEFDDAIIGKGSQRKFTIEFDETSLATKTGQIWEISIPALRENQAYEDYNVTLSVPNSFGKPANINPEPTAQSLEGDKLLLQFNKEAVSDTGVKATFGQFQVFTFDLTYHLENPLNRPASVDIAIPPDTSFQRVIYQNFSSIPKRVHIDEDGNWLANYELSERERKDINIKGAVQLFSQEQLLPEPSQNYLASLTKSSDFWQVNDPKIQELARTYDTPQKIYDYVSGNLSYNYDRVQSNTERLGAAKILENPDNAICMEYTDLFIAIARAAGIPAREVNGFAYTENPEIQPLSLVADVLHAWPEYWDSQRKIWVPVDPTWGSTTGGLDYFTKLDLRHFAFVMHGQDARTPYPPGSYKLGPNPQKDVYISFGKLPDERSPEITLDLLNKKALPFQSINYKILAKNTGPVAIYDVPIKVYYDQKESYTETIPVLVPHGEHEFTVKAPFGFFGNDSPDEVKIEVGPEVLVESTHKSYIITLSLTAALVLILFVLAFVYIRIKKINLFKYFKKRNEKSKKIQSSKNGPQKGAS